MALQSRRSPTVTDSDFEELGAEVLAKIERADRDGTLSNAPFYFDIVKAWSFMGRTADAKTWLATGMLDDAKFLAKTAWGLVSYSLGTNEKAYSLRERPEETLYDLSILQEATAKHAGNGELNQDERNRIRAVREGIERLLQQDAAKVE